MKEKLQLERNLADNLEMVLEMGKNSGCRLGGSLSQYVHAFRPVRAKAQPLMCPGSLKTDTKSKYLSSGHTSM